MYLKNELYELIRTDESIFDFIQESALDGLWYWNLEKPEDEWMNPKFWNVLGYNPDEMPHKSSAWQNIINQDDLKLASDNFTKHCENPNHPYDQIVRYTHKDGSTVWIRCSGMAIRDKAGKPIRMLGAHHDITDIKKREQELNNAKENERALQFKTEEYEAINEELLRTNDELIVAKERAEESEFKLKEAQQIAHVGNWELNILTNKLVWSDEIYRIFGCEPQEFSATYEAFLGFVHPDDRESVNSAYLKSLDTQTEYQIEHRIITKNNQIKYVKEKCTTTFNEQGKPLNSFGIVIDITEQKALENELLKAKERAEESEEKYRALYNNAPLSYQSLDENGCFIDINPMWLRTLGYERDEVIGKWYGDFLHPDYVEHFRINFPVFKKQGFISDVQFKLRRKDNTYITVSFEGCIGYTPEGKFKQTYCVFKDITEQKAVEKALIKAKEKAEESERRFDLAMKASNDGLFDWNLETNVIYYSPAWKKMLGYEEHELPNDFSVWENTTDPEDVKKSWELQQKLITKQVDRFVMEFKMKHKDGHWVDILSRAEAIFNEDGKAVRMVGTHTDITERKQAEEELLKAKEKAEESEEKLNSILINLSDVVWSISYPDLTHNFISPSLEKLYGRSKQELLDNPNLFEDITHPDDKHLTEKSMKQLLEEGKADRECRIIKPDGSIVWVNDRSKMIYDENQQPIRVDGVTRDITERKRAEAELIKAKEKAEESDRLKSAFLANMSHEIRTPMNGILGFAYLLKEPDLAGEEQQEYIEMIEKSGKRMLNIINDIVDISKIEAGLMEMHLNDSNINEQIEYIYTFFKPEANAKGLNITFNNPLPTKEAVIKTDREKLIAILTNLVKNALKFTDMGSIEFGYNLNNYIEQKELLFYVKDTGIGIPKDRQSAIFERFIQSDVADKEARQGSGLGLAISKAYIEMLGGNIRVESEVGNGSAFYFTLPVNAEPINETIIESLTPMDKSDSIRKLKILIVEDDEASEKLIERYINYLTKEIIKVRNGVEAVEICRANPDIDLILMDIQMPKLNGYEATKQIREFNKEVIIISQTAYGLTGDREKSLESGCNDYIAKPINKNEFLEIVNKYFGK